MVVIESKQRNAKFVEHHAVGAGALINIGLAILHNHENVLLAAGIIYLEIGEIVWFNSVRTGIDNRIAAADTVGIEVCAGRDWRSMLIVNLNVRRSAVKGLRIEIEAGQEGISQPLSGTSIIQSTVPVVHTGKIGSVLFEAVHKMRPDKARLHQGIAGFIDELLQVWNPAEAVEEHIIVVGTHHLQFSDILGIHLVAH